MTHAYNDSDISNRYNINVNFTDNKHRKISEYGKNRFWVKRYLQCGLSLSHLRWDSVHDFGRGILDVLQ